MEFNSGFKGLIRNVDNHYPNTRHYILEAQKFSSCLQHKSTLLYHQSPPLVPVLR